MVKIDTKTDALLLVDIQPTFMPGGKLAVKDGHLIVPIVCLIIRRFLKIIVTLDVHKKGSVFFANSYDFIQPFDVLVWDNDKIIVKRGEQTIVFNPKWIRKFALFTFDDLVEYARDANNVMIWPEHSIEGTGESKLHEAFAKNAIDYTLIKGLNPKCHAFSGFYDDRNRPTELADILRGMGIKRVFGCGLSEEYCLGMSLLDALKDEFEAFMIQDATRPLDYSLQNIEKTRKQLLDAGVQIIESREIC